MWDRLDGKPQQTVEASIDEKRSALDWSTDALVAFLNEQATELLRRRLATESLITFTEYTFERTAPHRDRRGA
jgi:hypothetical protein